MHQICFDKTKKEHIRLSAKYPYYSYTAIHATNLKGGYFEASNQNNFKESECLAAINKIPYYRQKITVNSQKKYRFIRFVAPNEKDCCLAELSFIGLNANKDTILLKPVQLYDGTHNDQETEILKDGKYNDFYTLSTNQLTADLGSPQQITHIELIPRSNTNGIIPGYQYELFYWAEKDGWKSLGIKKAIDWYISSYS